MTSPPTSSTPSYLRALILRSTSSKSSSNLPTLDAYYRLTLRPLILSRTPSPYLTLPELTKVMEWKLSRGKHRPTLMKLIGSNTPEEVERITLSALVLEYSSLSLKERMKLLCELRGVGPATASGILSLVFPVQVPFFSDEAWSECFGEKEKVEYSVKGWERFLKEMEERRGEGGMEEAECGMWERVVARK